VFDGGYSRQEVVEQGRHLFGCDAARERCKLPDQARFERGHGLVFFMWLGRYLEAIDTVFEKVRSGAVGMQMILALSTVPGSFEKGVEPTRILLLVHGSHLCEVLICGSECVVWCRKHSGWYIFV